MLRIQFAFIFFSFSSVIQCLTSNCIEHLYLAPSAPIVKEQNIQGISCFISGSISSEAVKIQNAVLEGEENSSGYTVALAINSKSYQGENGRVSILSTRLGGNRVSFS